MPKSVKAVYQKGVFVPQEPCDIPEGLEVELIIHSLSVLPPEVKEIQERKRILKIVVERMQQNPTPAGAPHLTRETLHERR
jgi:predicted DNA-binding antitoxin AbrB/MazE fold protein